MGGHGLNHVFVRHPPLSGVDGLCYGRLDVALAPEAIDAAVAALDGRLPDWPLLSSPSGRCLAVARALRPDAVRTDARLREMHFGDWEGRPWSAITPAALDAWAADLTGFRPPGGECVGELVARVEAALASLRVPHIILTHGGVVRAAWHLLGGMPLHAACAMEVPHLEPIQPARGAPSAG